MAGRARSWTAHLVLVLVATARCSAGQQLEQPGDPLDQLLALVSRAVEAATSPIVAELGSQRTLLDDIVSRLKIQDARLTIIQAVNSQDASLDSLNGRLDTLDARLVRQDVILDTIKAGQVTLNGRLDALIASTDTRNARTNSSVVAALQTPPRDCSDLPTDARTGIYTLQPGRGVGDLTDAAAFCDMETAGGGWTVIQRRADILPRQNFNLNWASYREGFGNISGEFWWGLEKVWLLTSSEDRRYELRIDLEGNDGQRMYALYQGFALSSEKDGYRLSGGDYSGDAVDGLIWHLGEQFSTKDRDQDTDSSRHCAQQYKGAWWYGDGCGPISSLNGVYGRTSRDGVWWYAGGSWLYHLKTAEMKVRPARRV